MLLQVKLGLVRKSPGCLNGFWRGPRGPQEAPKRPTRGLLAAMPPRGPQEAPKRPPRGHREATKRPQEAPKSSHMLTHMPARPLADMYTRVRTCSHTFTHVHTRSHMLTYVHTCPNVFTHVHTCAHMLTHVHTCSTWKRASRSQLLQVSPPARFSCEKQWFLKVLLQKGIANQ